MRPSPVWLIVIRVYQWFDKFLTLPIRYHPVEEKFYVNTCCFTKWYKIHMTSYRFGSLCVFSFFFRIIYKLFMQIVAPANNRHLDFGLEAVLLYTIGFLICLQAVFSFWTMEMRVRDIVSVMNLLLKINKCRPNAYMESRISFFGYVCIDSGAAVATVASLGFLAFPAIAGLVPFAMDHDPASHIALIIMPRNSHPLARSLLAGLVQGSVAAFGAIVCLQVLLVFCLVILCLGEMMNLAITDQGIKTVNLEAYAKLVMHGDKVAQTNKPSLFRVVKDLRRSFDNEAKCFRPILLIHRQLTILQEMSCQALVVLSPGLIFVGMSLIIVTLFFFIRFDLPLAVGIPNTVIALSVSLIIVGLIPVAEKLDTESAMFQIYWKRRLRAPLARKLLFSCRHCVLIKIGNFGSYHRGTLLIVWNIILQQLATLLLNF